MGTRHLYWILTGPSFAVQASVERLCHFFSRISFVVFRAFFAQWFERREREEGFVNW
jgi:hypothetical protein